MWTKENISDFFTGVDTKHANDRSFVPLHPTRTLVQIPSKSKYMLGYGQKAVSFSNSGLQKSHVSQRIWKCVSNVGGWKKTTKIIEKPQQDRKGLKPLNQNFRRSRCHRMMTYPWLKSRDHSLSEFR